MPSYTKPFLSLSDQLNLLKSRGMQVANDPDAIECLHRNGYYRLSAYWYPFRQIIAGKATDTFLSESHFSDAMALYRFDKQLKLLLLDAIERVEIAVRVEISLILGKLDPFAYSDPRWFRREFIAPNHSGAIPHQVWLDKLYQQIDNSNETFIRHHRQQYGNNSPLPIWIAIELWDFGMLSHAYKGMQECDQIAVVQRFSIYDWRLLASWLRTLNYVRNVIAHHGRLWNTNLSVNPMLPASGRMPNFDDLLSVPNVRARIYSVCCILCYFTRVTNFTSTWVDDLKSLIQSFPVMPHAGIKDMGFPANWQSHAFWN